MRGTAADEIECGGDIAIVLVTCESERRLLRSIAVQVPPPPPPHARIRCGFERCAGVVARAADAPVDPCHHCRLHPRSSPRASAASPSSAAHEATRSHRPEAEQSEGNSGPGCRVGGGLWINLGAR